MVGLECVGLGCVSFSPWWFRLVLGWVSVCLVLV